MWHSAVLKSQRLSSAQTSSISRSHAAYFMFLFVAAIFAAITFPASASAQMSQADIESIQKAINSQGASWTAGETSRTLMTIDERRSALGLIPDTMSADSRTQPPSGSMALAPTEFSWGNKDGWNWMTTIKNQGGCGSCWAFATAAAFEARLRINLNQPNLAVDVSEQNMVSCWLGSCEGANATWVMTYFQTYGCPDEACFPYASGSGTAAPCTDLCPDWASRVYGLTTYGNYNFPSVETIKNEIMLHGPVQMHMSVYADFDSYTGGVYQHVTGAYEGAHLVVMYGWDNANNCWLVKNSWGTDWGEVGPNGQRGWFRIRMGANEVGCESYIYFLQPIGQDYPVATSTSPAENAVGSATAGDITVNFDSDLDPATVSASSVFASGSISGPHAASVSYDNPTRSITINPDADFVSGEAVSVVMSPSIHSSAGMWMSTGHNWRYTTSVAPSSGAFAAAVDYSTSPAPLWMTTADLNGDGSSDLVSANATTASITVRLANGDGTFGSSTNYSVQNGPRSVVAADFDGDGDVDLAVANYQSHTISVLLNNGNGTFAPQFAVITVTSPRSVTATDIDADGDIDLVVGSATPLAIRIHYNNGTGSFTNMVQRSITGLPYVLTTADFDADGDFDVAYPAYSTNELVILWNDGLGTFDSESRFPVGVGPRSVAAADLNGDGVIDPVVANYSAMTVSAMMKTGFNSYTNQDLSTAPLSPEAVSVADINGDQHPDIVAFGNTGIVVIMNRGDGTFASAVSLATGSYLAGAAADFDGDHDLDLAGVSYDGQKFSVLLNGACVDSDGDGIGDPGNPGTLCGIDNCPNTANPDQIDSDSDGVGDACDNCRMEPNPSQTDTDGNCPAPPYASDPECGDICQTCCRGRVGDANNSGDEEPTIGDISVLIDAKFITGSCVGIVACLTEADINQSGSMNPTCDDVTIGDISTLIDYLFITGSGSMTLPSCL